MVTDSVEEKHTHTLTLNDTQSMQLLIVLRYAYRSYVQNAKDPVMAKLLRKLFNEIKGQL